MQHTTISTYHADVPPWIERANQDRITGLWIGDRFPIVESQLNRSNLTGVRGHRVTEAALYL